MSLVNLLNVQVGNNPATFFSPFAFEITFEVVSELKEDLEFKIVYVGSADDEQYDQALESVMVGPVPVGVSKFVLEAPAPQPDKIPAKDVLGVTVLLLQVSYLDKEFVRVGYYVNNEYTVEEWREDPPPTIDFTKIQRSILAEKPRVTRFPISWDKDENTAPASATDAKVMEAGQTMEIPQDMAMPM